MKKSLLFAVCVLGAVTCAEAQTRTTRRTGTRKIAAQEAKPAANDNRVMIDQFAKVGRQSTLPAPVIQGASIIGTTYNKPRRWIVLETKYTTFAKWMDRLTFTWHVILETKSATENKGNKDGLAPYSYLTTTVNYQNIPQGSHSAGVCLHPSYLERFGEPKAIGLVITDAQGEIIAGEVVSEIKGIKSGTKFWEDQQIMNAEQNGEPMIERRQGLLDRSKTIWALVNPNDYELVTQ